MNQAQNLVDTSCSPRCSEDSDSESLAARFFPAPFLKESKEKKAMGAVILLCTVLHAGSTFCDNTVGQNKTLQYLSCAGLNLKATFPHQRLALSTRQLKSFASVLGCEAKQCSSSFPRAKKASGAVGTLKPYVRCFSLDYWRQAQCTSDNILLY